MIIAVMKSFIEMEGDGMAQLKPKGRLYRTREGWLEQVPLHPSIARTDINS